jgi:hypothetical protein
MLGELTLLGGRIATSDHNLRIAYASQDTFIFPGTLRENVLLGVSFDANRYNAVINACGLVPDITRLTMGDATVLGDKGIILSGGQRQRVASASVFNFRYLLLQILMLLLLWTGPGSRRVCRCTHLIFGRPAQVRPQIVPASRVELNICLRQRFGC